MKVEHHLDKDPLHSCCADTQRFCPVTCNYHGEHSRNYMFALPIRVPDVSILIDLLYLFLKNVFKSV